MVSSVDPQSRTLPPEVRRRQILDAAAALAVERGFEKVSVAEVAKAAGIAKGTMYLHFESRTDLAAALLADLWDRMLEEPRQILERPGLSWAERLDAVVAAWITFEIDHHDLHHEVFHLVGDPDGSDPFDASRSLLVDLLAAGVEAGEFQVPDVALTADFLLFAYAGPCHHQTQEVADVIPAVQELFRRTVGLGYR